MNILDLQKVVTAVMGLLAWWLRKNCSPWMQHDSVTPNLEHPVQYINILMPQRSVTCMCVRYHSSGWSTLLPSCSRFNIILVNLLPSKSTSWKLWASLYVSVQLLKSTRAWDRPPMTGVWVTHPFTWYYCVSPLNVLTDGPSTLSISCGRTSSCCCRRQDGVFKLSACEDRLDINKICLEVWQWDQTRCWSAAVDFCNTDV